MSRLRLLAALALFLAGPATAEAPAAEPARPALWQLRDPDTTIYLFGTVHMLPAGVRWLDGRVAQAFDLADTLVLEIMLPDDPMQMMAQMAAVGRSPGLPPLVERVPEAQRARLAVLMKRYGIPTGGLDGYETWAAALLLQSAVLAGAGFSSAEGVEATLVARAKAAPKRLEGLETVAQQLAIFDELPEVDQRAFLSAIVAESSDVAALARAMVATWSRGDVDSLAQSLNDELDDDPELAKRLIADRNARWADWLVRRLDQPGRIFVAVGAGHLGGRESVIALLEARGLTVERIAPVRP